MKSPKFSVVTCSFNQGKFLDSTIRSVLDQGYPDLEYVVIDGGSSDHSVRVIQRYADRLAYWVSEPDRGQTDALCKGFERTDGEIMGWLCSDDILLPGTVEYVVRFFAENPSVEAMYGDALWMDADGRFIRPKREMPFNRFVLLFDHNFIPQPSMFWRRSLYEKVGGLDRRFDLAMDSDLWERFSRETHIVHVKRFLSCLRDYPEQKTRALRPQGAVEYREIRDRSSLARFMPGGIASAGARSLRVVLKAVAGGYRNAVDPRTIEGLRRYEIGE